MNGFDELRWLAALLVDGSRVRRFSALADDAAMQRFAQLAGRHLVVTALHGSIARAGALDALPADFRDYLASTVALNTQRNQRLLAQAAELHDLLAAAGVEFTALKGLAGLVAGLYSHPGERLISDLDLLVDDAFLQRAQAAMQAAGYRSEPDAGVDDRFYDRTHQVAPLVHEHHPAAVELHRRPLWSQRASAMLSAVRGPARAVACAGREWRVLDPTTWLAHVGLHQMVQDSAYVRGHFNLRQLLEARTLITKFGADIDFMRLEHAAQSSGCANEWAALRVSLHRLFDLELPAKTPNRLSGIWFARAAAQYRWPAIERGLQASLRPLRRLLPDRWRAKLGLADYGWKGS